MMSRCARPAVTVLMLGAAISVASASAPRPANAGPGEAGRGPQATGVGRPDRAGVDYIVLVWYRGDDALGTFEHQTYDVRKGEYTAAVDDWLEMMRVKHPRYVVRVLPVHLDRERGATEKLKVGSVIQRELLLAAARSGVVLGAPMQIGPGPFTSQGRVPSVNRLPAGPRNDRSFLNSSPTPSIPVYPRTRPP